MTIEEAEEKLSNMHFDNIVKSYCNKVNDIKRLKAEIKKLNEQLHIHDVVGQSEQLFCSMAGKGFCPYESKDGKCTMLDKCVNHTTK